MSKTPTAVYKSRAPHLIDEYDAATTERFEEYKAKAVAFKNELGVEQLSVNSGWDDIRVTGYIDPDRHADPKPGYRRDSKTGFMKPALRTAEGKAIAERLKGIRYVPGKKPGLPGVIMGVGYMGPFSLQKLDGEWYAVLTVPLEDDPEQRARTLREVDVQLWEPAKLSEYFLAVEAAEAQKEKTDA
jgi:hypothetical protein